MSERSWIARAGGRVAASAAVLVVAAMMAPGNASASLSPAVKAQANSAVFEAQGRAAGLSAAQINLLQAETTRYLRVLGGRQVALNKIDVDGKATAWIALPGEQHPRELSGDAGALDVNCDGSADHYHFCAYSGTYFTGSQIDMYACGTYSIPWSGNGSWDNDQSTGTQARMYGSAGTVIYTTPPAHSWDYSGDWTPVYKVRNC